MKALSIRQPWAWLITHGWKPVENRTRKSNYRGPLYIHAGKGMTRDDYAACMIFIAAFERRQERVPAWDVLRSECGGIVGRVNMVGCIEKPFDTTWTAKSIVNNYFTGPYGWLMQDAEVLPFFPCKGQLNFFEVSYEK